MRASSTKQTNLGIAVLHLATTDTSYKPSERGASFALRCLVHSLWRLHPDVAGLLVGFQLASVASRHTRNTEVTDLHSHWNGWSKCLPLFHLRCDSPGILRVQAVLRHRQPQAHRGQPLVYQGVGPMNGYND